MKLINKSGGVGSLLGLFLLNIVGGRLGARLEQRGQQVGGQLGARINAIVGDDTGVVGRCIVSGNVNSDFGARHSFGGSFVNFLLVFCCMALTGQRMYMHSEFIDSFYNGLTVAEIH